MDYKYIIFIFLSVCLCWFLIYHTAHASILDWFTRDVVAQEIPVIKTLDGEIDRLSIKYEVSSSTVRSIIKCESNFNPTAINYNRLNGEVWSIDYSYFQINDFYHKDTMSKLGLDYNNQWDSLEYGFILLKEQGVKPWTASATCHQKY